MSDDPGDGERLDRLNHSEATDEAVQPDLAALIRRVEDDGAAWRASLPAVDAVAQRIAALDQQIPERRSPSYRIREETLMQGQGHTDVTRPPTTTFPEHPARGRLRGILAGTTAVLVVALFAALVLTLLPGARSGNHTGASGTPTAARTHEATPTLAAQHGVWQADPYLAHTQAIPVVAPSDANVVYMAKGTRLQRSGDGGKTWSTLATPGDFPQGAAVQWLDVFVSPIDAHTLWATADLTTASGSTLPNCPVAPPFAFVGGSVVAGGSVPCQVQNVSFDGGQSWKLVKLAFAYMLGSASADTNIFNYADQYSQTPQVQADQLALRLYTLTSNGPLASSGNGPRLAVSSDNGQSWQPADTQLASAGLRVCDFAAAPGSRTLFAVTADTGCSPEYRALPALWRSDDAGAHWTRKTLPGGRLVAAIAVGGGPTPTLYALMPALSGQTHAVNTTIGPSDVFASADEGATWRQAPAAGIPPSSQNVPISTSAAVSVLSDGTLLAPFIVPDTAATGQVPAQRVVFFVWKDGATAWQQQSRLDAFAVATLQSVYTSSRDDLWLVTVDPPASLTASGLIFSVETYQP